MKLIARKVSKTYYDSTLPVEVLSGLDFELSDAEIVGICGVSGSGKSTLLHILGGLDSATNGNVTCDGTDLSKLKDDKLSEFRNKKVGFVFQFYHLMKEFSALENVMMPCLISGMKRSEAGSRALEALSDVGLKDRVKHFPMTLSGGEQQRVAIARAAVMRPEMILADEPTGNLDEEMGNQILKYLRRLNEEHKTALVIVSHNQELLKSLPKLYYLRNKRLDM
ncbi:MAG: ABC transporter ATP-binding protein [Pseudomonadota bacterium]